MATGGVGDVLSGVLGALVADGLSAEQAAVVGAHIHGRAGDLAAVRIGKRPMIASDMLAQLPHAFRELEPK
ncbi:MAG: NAD(P)H-hydrate dehydratase, partial [bacterium]